MLDDPCIVKLSDFEEVRTPVPRSHPKLLCAVHQCDPEVDKSYDFDTTMDDGIPGEGCLLDNPRASEPSSVQESVQALVLLVRRQRKIILLRPDLRPLQSDGQLEDSPSVRW